MSIAARNAILAGGAAPGPTPAYWGLCFTAEQANSTVAMAVSASGAPAVSVETSTDAVSWSPFVIGGTTITLANVGDKVYFRAGDGGTVGDGINQRMSGTSSNPLFTTPKFNKFVMTGQIAASGDVTSLLDRSGTVDSFAAQDGGISARTYAFWGLFSDCDVLTCAPSLPTTTLATGCYGRMFDACTGLTSIELPVFTLSNYCLRQMCRNCSALNTVKTGQTGAFQTSTAGANYQWLNGVAATGTFYCPAALGTNETITRGVSACPEGWTVINTDA